LLYSKLKEGLPVDPFDKVRDLLDIFEDKLADVLRHTISRRESKASSVPTNPNASGALPRSSTEPAKCSEAKSAPAGG
jgi:hypothetical protein